MQKNKSKALPLRFMSLEAVIPLITKDYGLSTEDLNEVIERENLRDVSNKFSLGIENTLRKFKSGKRIRILEFSENSGSTREARISLMNFINAEKNIFYNHVFSNRDCCVFFLYSGYKIEDEKLFYSRIIPHEFAHHYQFTEEGFPCLLLKGIPPVYFPQFATVHEIGPKHCEVYVGNILVKDCLPHFFKDFSERISDFICEGILIAKGFTEGYLKSIVKMSNTTLQN